MSNKYGKDSVMTLRTLLIEEGVVDVEGYFGDVKKIAEDLPNKEESAMLIGAVQYISDFMDTVIHKETVDKLASLLGKTDDTEDIKDIKEPAHTAMDMLGDGNVPTAGKLLQESGDNFKKYAVNAIKYEAKNGSVSARIGSYKKLPKLECFEYFVNRGYGIHIEKSRYSDEYTIYIKWDTIELSSDIDDETIVHESLEDLYNAVTITPAATE